MKHFCCESVFTELQLVDFLQLREDSELPEGKIPRDERMPTNNTAATSQTTPNNECSASRRPSVEEPAWAASGGCCCSLAADRSVSMVPIEDQQVKRRRGGGRNTRNTMKAFTVSFQHAAIQIHTFEYLCCCLILFFITESMQRSDIESAPLHVLLNVHCVIQWPARSHFSTWSWSLTEE